ncbi:hypothetical protein DOT_3037 [Desulfosporosinus sp. OT]|nr:hypothetical protein DOT_3037 [Desulfosporosinus sp. OT]
MEYAEALTIAVWVFFYIADKFPLISQESCEMIKLSCTNGSYLTDHQ